MPDDWTKPLPIGWSGGVAVTKWWRGNFVHLYRLHKPCAQCKLEMSIDVTQAALEGSAKNAGLQLKRCVTCREASKIGGGSRPRTFVPEVTSPPGDNELETLRMANRVMKEELDGLYGRDRGLFAEVQELKARLATYELQPAMVQAQNGTAISSVLPKMPWEH